MGFPTAMIVCEPIPALFYASTQTSFCRFLSSLWTMGPYRTTKPLNRRHQRRRRRHSTPPSPSLSKVPTENSKSYVEQPATSSSIPSDDNPNYSPSAYPDDLGYSPAYASSNSPYATSDYIPVAPLPVFSGELDECPFAHLLRFDCVCRVNNAASPAVAAHIFPASLYSYAGLWYSNDKSS